MLVLVLFISFILRLVNLNQSLWLDEAININNAAVLSPKDLIFKYALGDFHPPLYHLLLHYVIVFFGNSEMVARVPSVIFGIGTVFMTYLISKQLFDKKTALISAILIATAPLHIYYSQEARMYMAAAFFVSASVYYFLRILNHDNLLNHLLFIITTILFLYFDYLPYLIIPTYFLYLFVMHKKFSNSLKTFFPSFAIIFLGILPWLAIFPKQLKVGLSASAASPAWSNIVGSSSISAILISFVKFTIGRISIDNNFLYLLAFIPIGSYISFLFLLSLLRTSSTRSFLYFWFFTPIILGFLISFFVPVFSYFRFIFVLPAFYIVLASAINCINWTPLNRALLILILIINLVSTIIYFTNPKFQREDWKGALAYLHKQNTKDSIVLFESEYTTAPFDYYDHNTFEAKGALNGFEANSIEIKNKLNVLTQGKKNIYLFQYLTGITDPEGLVYRDLTERGFTNTKTDDFKGVGFIYEFKR